MFAAVMEEVVERKKFLQMMGAQGNRPYEAQIRAEISSRVAELRKIDAMIKGPETDGWGKGTGE